MTHKCNLCPWQSFDTGIISECLSTWHVYEQHRDTWNFVMGDRPPYDPDPRTPEGRAKIAKMKK